MKKEDLTKEVLVAAGTDLNEVLEPNPPIVVALDETPFKGIALVNAKKKFASQLGKDLVEAAGLIAPTDVLEPATVDTLEILGVEGIRERLVTSEKVSVSKKEDKKKDKPDKEADKKPAKKSVKGKEKPKSSAGKVVDDAVKRNKYGIKEGTTASQAIEMLATGKHTMADLKKKFGATFYDPLKKAVKAGFKVERKEDGTYSIK